MTSEERIWYINRYNEEQKKKQDQERKSSKTSTPRAPHISRPSIRR